jgi:hypothetical protein
MTTKLSPRAERALAALRREVESVDTFVGDPETQWGSVYLDNAKPDDINARSWAGLLSRLERCGLYRKQGEDGAFGYVKMLKEEQWPT